MLFKGVEKITRISIFCLEILLGVFSLFTSVFAQGWQCQNPLPQGNPLLAIDFVYSLNGWMAGASSTLIHTTDVGETWEVQTTDKVSLFWKIDFLAQMVGWGAGQDRKGGVIVKTTDGGNSWQVSFADSLAYLDIIFVDERHGWAVGRKGAIVHTSDGGITWGRQESSTMEDLESVTFVDTWHGWIIGDTSPLLITTDGGKTWVRNNNFDRGGTKIVFVDSLRGWILTEFIPRVYRSTDGGKTWTLIRDSGGAETGWDMVFVDSLRGWISVDGSLGRTEDGGKTWRGLRDSPPWQRIFFLDDGMTGWAANGFKFGVTQDRGESWEEKSSAVTTARLFSVDFVNESEGWIIGEDVIEGGVILHTEDGGRSWAFQDGGPSNVFQDVFFLDEKRGWCVGSTVIYTEDGGQSWLEQSTNASGAAIYFVDERQGWTVGSRLVNNSVVQGTFFHTEDGGKSWIGQTHENIPRLRDVVFVDSLNGWVVGGGRGLPIAEGGIWHTRDGGKTWEDQIVLPNLQLEAVTFLSVDVGWAAGVTEKNEGIIYHTIDGGETWIIQYLEGFRLTDIRFIDNHHGWALGISGTLVHTTDGGQTWQEQKSPTSLNLFGLDFLDIKTGWIIGWGGTILHTTTGGVTPVDSNPFQEPIPHSFILRENFPNPFNSGTRISFEILKSNARVKLTIYDVLGRKVRTLLDAELSRGPYSIAWDGTSETGSSVAGGVLFYRLQVGQQTETKKMLLLR